MPQLVNKVYCHADGWFLGIPLKQEGVRRRKEGVERNRNKDVFRIEEEKEKERYEWWLLAASDRVLSVYYEIGLV